MTRSLNIINLMASGSPTVSDFGLAVLDGLCSNPKTLPSRFLYDSRGSDLFEEITCQSEYYPTNCEIEILKKRTEEIKRIISDRPFRLVELGGGSAKKTKILLSYLLEHGLEFEYVLVDWCKEMVEQATKSLKEEYKGKKLKILGIVGSYSMALSWLSRAAPLHNFLLFLGSSIGNFNFKEMTSFLLELWNSLNDGDGLLIGFDLKKDIDTLEKAYDDRFGVTRKFNLNLLDRLNEELQANFDKNTFVHHSFYNPGEGRMESWLVSTKEQNITVGKLQKTFPFDAWEGIHVESSYKYSIKQIETIAQTTGFSVDKELTDSKEYFLDSIWQVRKAPKDVK